MAAATQPKIGLALAGGAAEGAIYEIGAIHALDEAIQGLDLRHLDIYVGVSAGAFLTACLANGLSTAQMCRAITKPEPGEHPFVPELFFRPAVKELGKRAARIPGLLTDAIRGYLSGREKRLLDALTSLGGSLPVALFDNKAIRRYVQDVFSIKNRTDDFRELESRLVVVATDLESGEPVRFGEPGWDAVPISQAVQASSALPGLYPPVTINGRRYVDGILRKTMHASVALEAECDLVLCVNPIVPVDVRRGLQDGTIETDEMIDRGLPTVLGQALRTLIHSRMRLGFRHYADRYPDADVLLVEPRRDDYENFFSNIFTFSSRRAVCERAYQATRRYLYDNRDSLAPVLAKHDLRLDVGHLQDLERPLWPHVSLPGADEPETPDRPAVAADLAEDLDRILERAERLAAQ